MLWSRVAGERSPEPIAAGAGPPRDRLTKVDGDGQRWRGHRSVVSDSPHKQPGVLGTTAVWSPVMRCSSCRPGAVLLCLVLLASRFAWAAPFGPGPMEFFEGVSIVFIP
jgi:hypothetical protein